VLRVALSELDIPYVLVDARALRRNYSRSDLFRLIAQGLSDSLDKIKDLLMGIRGLRVMGVDVEVFWRGSDSLSLVARALEILLSWPSFYVSIFMASCFSSFIHVFSFDSHSSVS
jgi:hypothetical protein